MSKKVWIYILNDNKYQLKCGCTLSDKNKLRIDKLTEINGVKVVKAFDYKLSEETVYGSETSISEINLPKSNILKYILEDDSWFVVRPSGTEPKMKIYLSIVGKSLDDSEEKLNKFKNVIMKKINNILC